MKAPVLHRMHDESPSTFPWSLVCLRTREGSWLYIYVQKVKHDWSIRTSSINFLPWIVGGFLYLERQYRLHGPNRTLTIGIKWSVVTFSWNLIEVTAVFITFLSSILSTFRVIELTLTQIVALINHLIGADHRWTIDGDGSHYRQCLCIPRSKCAWIPVSE